MSLLNHALFHFIISGSKSLPRDPSTGTIIGLKSYRTAFEKSDSYLTTITARSPKALSKLTRFTRKRKKGQKSK